MAELSPLEPTPTAHLFPGLGRELLTLLRDLAPEDWDRPTVCSKWAVRDVAAHLLDSACRRLGVERDAHTLPPPTHPIDGYESLVAYLDELNADWVRAARRLSPRLLADLMESVEADLAPVLADLDPFAEARFPVSWAGEDGSRVWFDVARELTERWLHQQQIRLAVGAEPLTDPELSEPIFDTFLRAVPHRYRDVDASPGTAVAIELIGARRYDYVLQVGDEGWMLAKGQLPHPSASLSVSEETAWLSLTKGIAPEEALSQSQVSGDAALVHPFFETVAVMA